jgi:hypothetical protein
MDMFTDEDLILFHYGELDAARAAALHTALARDTALVARLADIERALGLADAMPVPRTPPDIGARVWQAIEPRLETRRPASPRVWQVPAALAAGLALVAISFQVGRQTVEHPVVPTVTVAANTGFSAATRERALVAQVAHHLEGSQRLLTTVANATPDAEALEAERKWARDLLVTNRLYRKAAVAADQKRIVQLLDAMEPVLLELANAPSDLDAEGLASIQKRIEDEDLVFRARSTNRALAPNPLTPGGIRTTETTAL